MLKIITSEEFIKESRAISGPAYFISRLAVFAINCKYQHPPRKLTLPVHTLTGNSSL
jgi:hypothetical protein